VKSPPGQAGNHEPAEKSSRGGAERRELEEGIYRLCQKPRLHGRFMASMHSRIKTGLSLNLKEWRNAHPSP